MATNTMPLLLYNALTMASQNGVMTSVDLSTIVMSPLVAVVALCVIGLLLLGGLWLKGRYPNSRVQQEGSTEKSSALSSTYDYVTGLPTRRLFGTLLEQAVGRAAKTGRPLALLVVELDHFRLVTERQGQANGNVLVRVQAARVKGVLRSTETVARLAQDQLAMILDNLASPEEITAIVDKLQATVGLPLTLEGQELFLTCRIGVALYPQDATEPDELIKQAMRAVKSAKSEGQAIHYASPAMAVSSASDPVPVSPPFAGLHP